MKKTIMSAKHLLSTLVMIAVSISANAMSYEQARNEALFLTDKMAYELNLNDEQYEAAYEINLDYLMGVTGQADVFGAYWERRNLDLSYILFDWQWNAFVAASYFYRPLHWEAGYWHFGIYRRYPHRDYFYFGRPHFYVTYRGGHAWHRHGAHGYYHGHSNHYRNPTREHIGMHDRWNRGDFRGSRNSSTRVTGDRHPDRRNTSQRNEGRRDNKSMTNRSNDNRNRSNNSNFSGSRNKQNSSANGNHSRVTERGRSVSVSGSRSTGSSRSNGSSRNTGGSHSSGSHGHGGRR